MAEIKEVIDKILKEPIAHYLCDSGGAYGYIYERNQEEGYLKGLNPVEEYTDEDKKERRLYVTIPVYDLLTYNCVKDDDVIQFEKKLFKAFEERGFEPYEIYEVEEYLKNDGKKEFGITETGISSLSYTNTYNYEEYISQTLLYITFSYDDDDYLLLEVHNGCDVRSGYTYPQLFKLEDIEYFLSGLSDRVCQCECGLNDYTFYGYDDVTDSDGEYVDANEIYKRTYVDKDDNVRCEKCKKIIKGGFMEW